MGDTMSVFTLTQEVLFAVLLGSWVATASRHWSETRCNWHGCLYDFVENEDNLTHVYAYTATNKLSRNSGTVYYCGCPQTWAWITGEWPLRIKNVGAELDSQKVENLRERLEAGEPQTFEFKDDYCHEMGIARDHLPRSAEFSQVPIEKIVKRPGRDGDRRRVLERMNL